MNNSINFTQNVMKFLNYDSNINSTINNFIDLVFGVNQNNSDLCSNFPSISYEVDNEAFFLENKLKSKVISYFTHLQEFLNKISLISKSEEYAENINESKNLGLNRKTSKKSVLVLKSSNLINNDEKIIDKNKNNLGDYFINNNSYDKEGFRTLSKSEIDQTLLEVLKDKIKIVTLNDEISKLSCNLFISINTIINFGHIPLKLFDSTHALKYSEINMQSNSNDNKDNKDVQITPKRKLFATPDLREIPSNFVNFITEVKTKNEINDKNTEKEKEKNTKCEELQGRLIYNKYSDKGLFNICSYERVNLFNKRKRSYVQSGKEVKLFSQTANFNWIFTNKRQIRIFKKTNNEEISNLQLNSFQINKAFKYKENYFPSQGYSNIISEAFNCELFLYCSQIDDSISICYCGNIGKSLEIDNDLNKNPSIKTNKLVEDKSRKYTASKRYVYNYFSIYIGEFVTCLKIIEPINVPFIRYNIGLPENNKSRIYSFENNAKYSNLESYLLSKKIKENKAIFAQKSGDIKVMILGLADNSIQIRLISKLVTTKSGFPFIFPIIKIIKMNFNVFDFTNNSLSLESSYFEVSSLRTVKSLYYSNDETILLAYSESHLQMIDFNNLSSISSISIIDILNLNSSNTSKHKMISNIDNFFLHKATSNNSLFYVSLFDLESNYFTYVVLTSKGIIIKKLFDSFLQFSFLDEYLFTIDFITGELKIRNTLNLEKIIDKFTVEVPISQDMQIMSFDIRRLLITVSNEDKPTNNLKKQSNEYDDLKHNNRDNNNNTIYEIDKKNRKRTKSDSSLNGRTSLRLDLKENDKIKKKLSKSIIKNTNGKSSNKLNESKKFEMLIAHKNGTISTLIISTNY